MKEARTYEKKIKKLLSGLKSSEQSTRMPPDQGIALLVESILLADATRNDVGKAMSAIEKEFVDFNELRVAPPKEIVECIGKDYPDARNKADTLAAVLNGIFTMTNQLSLDYLTDKPKREIRRYLSEMGVPPFAEAMVSQSVFEAHAIPVDQSLVDLLKMNDLVHPDTDVSDTQSFLERIIAQKDGPSATAFLQNYFEKNQKALEKWRAGIEAQKAAEEEAARKAAEEAEKAEKARQEKKAKAAAKKKKAAKKKATKKKSAKKKTARKTAKKTAKKKSTRTRKKATKKKTATKKKKAAGKKTTKKSRPKRSKPTAKKKSSGKKSTGRTAKKKSARRKAKATKKKKK